MNYLPDSFLYDPQTGYNYFFWREVFVNDDGSLLHDGNYYRFKGHLEDVSGSHEAVIHPLLAPKCQTYPAGDCNSSYCFISNALASLNHFLFGCIATTPAEVTLATNPTKEQRLLIDATKTLAAPTQECMFCLNADENNLYINQLEQEIICGSWYTFNEAPIDSFEFYLGNKNSDYSKTGNDRQFIHLQVPYPLIAFNDLTLMKKSMAVEYGTEADTVGELIWQVGNKIFTGIANPLVDIPEGLTASGLIPNAGFDCNFSRALDPTYVDGMVFFKLKGIQTINQQDYLETYPELEGVETKDFLEYLNYQSISFPSETTRIQVFVSDLTKVIDSDKPSPIVINAPYSETAIQQENVEGEIVQYQTVPSRLQFIAINDLIYNNERNVIRRYVPFTITAIISPEFVDIIGGIGQSFTEFLNNPWQWFFQNWFLLFIAGVVALFIVSIWRKARGSGSKIVVERGG